MTAVLNLRNKPDSLLLFFNSFLLVCQYSLIPDPSLHPSYSRDFQALRFVWKYISPYLLLVPIIITIPTLLTTFVIEVFLS